MVTTPANIPTSPTTANLSGLVRQLVRHQLLSEEKALELIEQARKNDQPLPSWLVENRLVRACDMARIAAQEFKYPLLDLGAFDLDAAPIKLVDEKLIRRHQALPLYKRGNRLFIGVADPTHLRALEDIKFQSGLNPEPVVVAADVLAQAIERALDRPSETMARMLDADLENINISSGEPDAADTVTALGDPADDAPVVRFVNKLLLDAINKGASDIHFEPYEHYYRVRFRQDGILREVIKPPVNMKERLAARIKVMAQLDIAERRVPQDGRIKLNLSRNRAIDFRVNTMPTLFGEKVVLRILDPSSARLGIDALGYEPQQKELFLNAIHKPQGMVLVTGPTGSGKTVSLYTALNILNTAEVNISTAEDPVEINLPGINQVNVNLKTGMTFANALRAFLRQDPDIIMVGEIRDLETAEIAIKAAQTGHMVLSTLHTNSAPQTLSRLMNMGVAPYNIASSVTLIIAQRLARRLCPHCKEEERGIPPEELLRQGFREEELEHLAIYRAVGCDQCTGGYKGRVGIYEVMPVSEAMGRLIMSGGNALELADQARREGINDLRRSGLNKVREGITSLEEVNRVTKD
ncbi:MAG TPA: type IV-A pilus assembly ATPase PilB [Candidatus Competibacteraceae bacterium]|nr:type IV-A pilus assembly ATPase PilB [Candidatus Competibacteraceae bacterium]